MIPCSDYLGSEREASKLSTADKALELHCMSRLATLLHRCNRCAVQQISVQPQGSHCCLALPLTFEILYLRRGTPQNALDPPGGDNRAMRTIGRGRRDRQARSSLSSGGVKQPTSSGRLQRKSCIRILKPCQISPKPPCTVIIPYYSP